jgi:VWFA-related protein
MKHVRVGIGVLSLCLALLVAQSAIYAQTPTPPPPAKVEIAQLDNSRYPDVTLYVRVLDQAGQHVNGLTRDNFVITEDDASVVVSNFKGQNTFPIVTLLVIDKSNSMKVENKMEGAKQAAAIFIDLMRAQDQAALIAFDNGVNVLQDFTTDRASLKAKINLLAPGDCTSWYEAIYKASNMIARQADRKSIILVSDGMDCREDFILHEIQGYGSYHSFEEAVREAQKAGTPVYAIALGHTPAERIGMEGYDEGRMKRMAADTGGKYYHAPTADQLSDLYRTLSEDTQKEYVLTYKSPRPSYDGTRRNIQVKIQSVAGSSAVTSGTVTYLEEHLVNIQSDWRIAAVILAPLLLLLVVPLTIYILWAQRLHYMPSPTTAMKTICPQCGNPLRAGARFCGRCGARL